MLCLTTGRLDLGAGTLPTNRLDVRADRTELRQLGDHHSGVAAAFRG